MPAIRYFGYSTTAPFDEAVAKAWAKCQELGEQSTPEELAWTIHSFSVDGRDIDFLLERY